MKKCIFGIAALFIFLIGVYLSAKTAETGSILGVFESLGCLGASCTLLGSIDDETDDYEDEPWWTKEY